MRSQKRIFNIASYDRLATLKTTLMSIKDQADEINCVLNCTGERMEQRAFGFDKAMNEAIPHCKFWIEDNYFGDAEKFKTLRTASGYFFTIDDDLIYPADYAEKMIKAYEDLGGCSIVALHGRNFKSFPIFSYYTDSFVAFRALDKVENAVQVQFAGTCTTMWHTDLLRFDYQKVCIYPNMADIWLAQEARKRDIDIVVLPHEADFLKYTLGCEDETIFKRYKKNHEYQTMVANSIYAK